MKKLGTYKFSYKESDRMYVGQRKSNTDDRIEEYLRNTRLSAVALHSWGESLEI